MSKKRINEWILMAKDALEKTKIAKGGKINKTYRGQIASFGAAVTMGSLPAAVAFFSKKARGESEVDRSKLICAMYYCISKEEKKAEEILEIVCNNNNQDMKSKFMDASVALKLAMNFFELEEEKE